MLHCAMMNAYVEYNLGCECPSIVHGVADFIKDDTRGKGMISSVISKDITLLIIFFLPLRLSPVN